MNHEKISRHKAYFISAIIALELLCFLLVIGILGVRFEAVSATAHMVSVAAIVYLINKEIVPTFKLAWIMLIMVFPVLGGAVYFLFGRKRPAKDLGAQYIAAKKHTLQYNCENENTWSCLQEDNPYIASQSKYLIGKGFPVFQNTECTYYPMADVAYADILLEIAKASRYIFLEYFIIADDGMWASILRIVQEKVEKGVEVRIIYDDFASIQTLPHRYWKQLEQKGIKCIAFNPFIPSERE